MRSRVLFVTLTNDVGSERIVCEMGRHGALCAVLGPPRSFASLVRCVATNFAMSTPLGRIGMAFALTRALESAWMAWRPDRIVPLDELAATLLRAIGTAPATAMDLRTVLGRSLGTPSGYDAACHRVALMKAAVRAGVRTPGFAAAAGTRVAGTPRFPVMVKRDQSSGSGGVARVETSSGLATALRSAWLKTAAKSVLARFAGFSNVVTPTLIQEVIQGRLAMYTVACQDGQVIDGAGFEAVEAHPVTKASTVLRFSPNREMADAARRLAAALGCSGFVSFDFILDQDDGAFLIEMNPRPVGSTHLGRLFGHDLIHAFLTGKMAGESEVINPEGVIALFPKELERDPASRYLGRSGAALHDVPENEPAVLAAYLTHLETGHRQRHDAIRRHLVPVAKPSGRSVAVPGMTELC